MTNDLFPLPRKRERWTRIADGAQCTVVTAWDWGANNGVVVRWPPPIQGRAHYGLAEFLQAFALAEPELFAQASA